MASPGSAEVLGDGENPLLWSAVSAAVAAAGVALVNYLRTRQETASRAEVGTNEEYRKLVKAYEGRVTRLEKRSDQQDEEIGRLGEQYRKVLIREARCEERVARYEDALRGAGIAFKPYQPGDGPDDGEAQGDSPREYGP